MRFWVFGLISVLLVSFVSAETTFFEGDLGLRDDFVMGDFDEVVDSSAVELLQDPFVSESGGRIYFEREEYNSEIVCEKCFEFLRETITEKRDLEYSQEELEVLFEDLNAETEQGISLQQLGYVVENFEDECDSPLPLLGAAVGGRDVDLLSPFVLVIVGIVLVFVVILYFVVRTLRKVRKR